MKCLLRKLLWPLVKEREDARWEELERERQIRNLWSCHDRLVERVEEAESRLALGVAAAALVTGVAVAAWYELIEPKRPGAAR